ncbi:beta-xylosidase [Amycolatopsis minnesotensis]|uniref:Beta-xylosidase n=1 Tax=Amycolatopsis minnesotensis TaxID=337894 RepID=A0ABP5DYB7_9PSEU
MRTFRQRRARLLAVAAGAVLGATALTGCSDSGELRAEAAGTSPGSGGSLGGSGETSKPRPPRPHDVPLNADAGRGGGAVVAAGGPGAPYNYGPSAMADGPTTRMWWCSQYPSAMPAGDDILYGESPKVDGPFTAPGGGPPVAVLSGNPGQFDGMHTCDPSVLRVDGTYYLYYTGAAGDHALGNSVGLATSADGITWTRANGGKPILNPAHDVHRDNNYGSGQPSVVYLGGWFYLMFTDTTGRAAGWNGAGQFLLRSKDPAFASGVEALGEKGFAAAATTSAQRTRSLVDAFSADLMWVEALDAFVIAHETSGGTTLTFWDRDFTANPFRPVTVPGAWQEGPGLVRAPDGHAPLSQADPCGRVPFDVVRATVIGGANAPTDLRHFGIDVHGVRACTDPGRTLAVLDGFAMPSPDRTMDLVIAGRVLRVDRRSVAERLATTLGPRRLPVLDGLPVAARLGGQAPAVRTPDGRTGFVLADGTLWRVRPGSVAEVNGSPVETVTDERWRSYPAGASLGR